jgi:hypothetical protein
MKLHQVSLSLLALSLALSGCALVQAQQAADTEAILEEAGFQRIELDKALPPLQLVARGNGYEFADPRFCQCTYHGDEKQYAQLQSLRAARLRAHESQVRSIGITSTGAHGMAWGAWNPEGLDLHK